MRDGNWRELNEVRNSDHLVAGFGNDGVPLNVTNDMSGAPVMLVSIKLDNQAVMLTPIVGAKSPSESGNL